jgi:uncharacterized flavoprotein (TIGR03862 family)
VKPKSVSIIGGGPSALIAAYFLSSYLKVNIYEKEKNIGQKFLVAGKGGFNLTNSLKGECLAKKYTPYKFMKSAIFDFDSTEVRNWLRSLGIETFEGTSGRVFAKKEIKPIEVLDKIKHGLKKKKVNILTGYKFSGFDELDKPIIIYKNERISDNSDFYIFALGGASWPITGSDGKWLSYFQKIGIKTKPFQPSNCGVNLIWPKEITEYHIGKPLKNLELSVSGIKSRGEAVITQYGLEGNAVYSIVPLLRDKLKNSNPKILIDFKPNNSIEELNTKMKGKAGNSNNYRKVLNLNSVELSLLKSSLSKDKFVDSKKFIKQIKKLSLKVESLRPIEEAISSVGGIDTSELNFNFSLKKFPNFYTIGEMVDWDAPTGGFLLQGCFSMGHFSAMSIISH